MFRLAAALILLAFPALADDITGKARVIDGEVSEVGGHHAYAKRATAAEQAVSHKQA